MRGLKLVWLAFAGALGTLARFAVSSLAQKLTKSDFPVGTMAVNLIGCFLFGLV